MKYFLIFLLAASLSGSIGFVLSSVFIKENTLRENIINSVVSGICVGILLTWQHYRRQKRGDVSS